MQSTELGAFGTADFIGGHVVLDFLNTVSDIDKNRQHSRVGVWQDFENWLKAANDGMGAVVVPFGSDGQSDKSVETRILNRVHDLRESTHGVLHAYLKNSACEAQAQDQLQRMIVAAIGRASFRCSDTDGVWSPSLDPRHHHVDHLALMVHRFLNVEPLHKLAECSSCSWLFLDVGRGKRRRWCDMSTCGNRAKAAAHRQRQRVP